MAPEFLHSNSSVNCNSNARPMAGGSNGFPLPEDQMISPPENVFVPAAIKSQGAPEAFPAQSHLRCTSEAPSLTPSVVPLIPLVLSPRKRTPLSVTQEFAASPRPLTVCSLPSIIKQVSVTNSSATSMCCRAPCSQDLTMEAMRFSGPLFACNLVLSSSPVAVLSAHSKSSVYDEQSPEPPHPGVAAVLTGVNEATMRSPLVKMPKILRWVIGVGRRLISVLLSRNM